MTNYRTHIRPTGRAGAMIGPLREARSAAMSGRVHLVEDEGMDGAVPPIEFVTDGRLYEPTGGRSGEFIAVFGTLVTGPAAPSVGATGVVDPRKWVASSQRSRGRRCVLRGWWRVLSGGESR